MTSRRLLSGAVAALTLLVLAGCGGGVPTATGDELSDGVTQRLKMDGRAVDDVSCPELKGDKGKKVTCQATRDGKDYDVVVTATGFSKNAVNFTTDTSKVPKG